MAVNETVGVINETVIGVPLEAFGTLVNVIAALGGIVFLYLVFSITNFIINRKKYKNIEEMNKKLDEIIGLLKKDKKNKKK